MRPEGIWACNGCGRQYAEYVNGCVEDHGPPRKVELAITDPDHPTPVLVEMYPEKVGLVDRFPDQR